MENEPLISVLMTAYNREQYIAEAIESVINSTYQNWELIIVDDGSKDNTVAIAKSYAEKDPRIKFYQNEVNLGDYPNRNKAASYANGEYLMHCDSDDSLLPDGIEYCIKSMLQFPESNFGIYWARNASTPFIRTPEVAAKKNFFGEPFLAIGPGSTILKRDYFLKIGNYPVKYGPANDMYFNIKAICFTKVVLLPRRFSNYRIHDNQERNNFKSYLLNGYLYNKDAFEELPIPLTTSEINWLKKKNKRRFFVNLVKYFFKTKNPKEINFFLKKSGFGIKDVFTAIFQI
jgi:glycosyltransferase involved in cell wall biosynthesis